MYRAHVYIEQMYIESLVLEDIPLWNLWSALSGAALRGTNQLRLASHKTEERWNGWKASAIGRKCWSHLLGLTVQFWYFSPESRCRAQTTSEDYLLWGVADDPERIDWLSLMRCARNCGSMATWMSRWIGATYWVVSCNTCISTLQVPSCKSYHR